MGNLFSRSDGPSPAAAPAPVVPAAPDRSSEEHRAEAKAHFERCNELFSQATAAYNAGRKEEAKALSAEGKAESALMRHANLQAAEAAQQERNVGRESHELDLHGLFVKEAQAAVKKRVKELRRGGAEGYLTCIVGKGLHSEGGVRKLEPAVRELAGRLGLRVTVQEGNEGCLLLEWDARPARPGKAGEGGVLGWLRRLFRGPRSPYARARRLVTPATLRAAALAGRSSGRKKYQALPTLGKGQLSRLSRQALPAPTGQPAAQRRRGTSPDGLPVPKGPKQLRRRRTALMPGELRWKGPSSVLRVC